MEIIQVFAAGKDGCLAVAQGEGRNPSPFQRFPTDLQPESLLGIEHFCLTGGNPKELGIKLVDVGDETAVPIIDFAYSCRIGVIVRVCIPAICGHLADGVASSAEQIPELFWGVGARETASHSDDGDWFCALMVQRIQLGLQFFDGQQGSFGR